MLNYVRGELYKVLHRKYIYIFMGVMLACEVLLVAGFLFTNARGGEIDFYTGGGTIVLLLTMGLYATIIMTDMVFSEQYKYNTLKNEVSYGLPRARIYLGKLIVECIVALVLCVVIVAVYVGLCYLLLPHGEADGEAFRMIGYCLLAALPLWLGAQALSHLVSFSVKSSTVAGFLVVGILAAAGSIFQLLAALVSDVFIVCYNVLLSTPFDTAYTTVGDWGFVGGCFAIGAGWFIVCTVVGVLTFQRKEIS